MRRFPPYNLQPPTYKRANILCPPSIYQGHTPVSPMQTGTTNQYPNQPLGSPPLDTYQHQQPIMAQQPQPMSSPPLGHPKGDYYGSQQQVPMQQVQTGQPPMQQQSQFHTATPLGNLGEGAAPVDCPCCRQRALTRTTYHSGNTTKYVKSCSMCIDATALYVQCADFGCFS